MLIVISTEEDNHPLSKRGRALAWQIFLAGGGRHSAKAMTMAYVIRRCERERVPYVLTARPGEGYHLKPLLGDR